MVSCIHSFLCNKADLFVWDKWRKEKRNDSSEGACELNTWIFCSCIDCLTAKGIRNLKLWTTCRPGIVLQSVGVGLILYYNLRFRLLQAKFPACFGDKENSETLICKTAQRSSLAQFFPKVLVHGAFWTSKNNHVSSTNNHGSSHPSSRKHCVYGWW
jgi:hypothetical protein